MNFRRNLIAGAVAAVAAVAFFAPLTVGAQTVLKAAGVEFVAVDQKLFYDATAPVRAKYGSAYAELIKRIEAVK